MQIDHQSHEISGKKCQLFTRIMRVLGKKTEMDQQGMEGNIFFQCKCLFSGRDALVALLQTLLIKEKNVLMMSINPNMGHPP